MLSAFMQEVPQDWGQVYLGGQFLHREPERISPWVLRPYNVNRTHAFALSKATIPRYLQHIMHAPDYFNVQIDDKGTTALNHNGFHIDHQLGRAHERGDWKTYAPAWWLAGQEAGGSNISGHNNPRLWWHWRERGHHLPFYFLPPDSTDPQRAFFRRYLHPGNNTLGNTMIDVGLDKELNDEDLTSWLKMIAGEAIELWKLPCFEVPAKQPDLSTRVQKLWAPGLQEAEENSISRMADYPFSGFCGEVPHGFREAAVSDRTNSSCPILPH